MYRYNYGFVPILNTSLNTSNTSSGVASGFKKINMPSTTQKVAITEVLSPEVSAEILLDPEEQFQKSIEMSKVFQMAKELGDNYGLTYLQLDYLKILRENPNIEQTILGQKSIAQLSELLTTFKAKKMIVDNFLFEVRGAISEAEKAGSNIADTLKETQTRAKGTQGSLTNAISILTAYIDRMKYIEEDKELDAKAVARGYENQEEAKAIRQVEIEWYFKLYGIYDPIEILAYQKMEKAKYGMTTWEATLQGKPLVPLNPQEETEALQEADQISNDVAQADEDKKKKKQMLIYGGIGVATIIGIALFMRK